MSDITPDAVRAMRERANGIRHPWAWYIEDIYKLADSWLALHAEIDKLSAFKKWVHDYLDGKGIPHHPPGTHGAEGCRIGDRMDYVFAEIERLKAERDDLAMRTREVSCVWCGHQFVTTLQSQAAELYEHAKQCEKHPVRKAEAERDDLRRRLEKYEANEPWGESFK